MKQQINLYHPMFRRQRAVFSAASMARGLALAVIGLATIHAYPAWQVHALAVETDGLADQREAALTRLARLEELVPARAPSKLLASEVDRLASEVVHRRELLAAFSRRVKGAEGGFSEHLAGLARQRVEGLWLTDLAVRDGGDSLEIGGRAISPELVPILVQRLAGEPVFAGATFDHLTIERDRDGGSRVDFRIATRVPGR